MELNNINSIKIEEIETRPEVSIIKCSKCNTLYILSVIKRDKKYYKLSKKQDNCCPYCGHIRWKAKEKKRRHSF